MEQWLVFRAGALILAEKLIADKSEAQDIVQEALVKAGKARKIPDGEESSRAWFFTIVHNLCIDTLRVRHRLKYDSTISMDREVCRNCGPQETLEKRQQADQLRQAIAQLSLEHREIIALKDMLDFNYSQVGQILGLTPGTVMSRLHRARTQLREHFLTIGGRL
ncbi:RNA polymerase sigma factor [Teredinibacter turnerae T7901]|uniref:RNA polymerase sigma factor n=2 Tax=Teredinibacter turnerae TaxID=2426 RepID=C5BNJ0_TERTT|nr:sigma-70 family RNA polymerase sigma factor [Teredinibacter turnerae]ACR11037.1 RNA polymerase sigma factor [Teredinibacter turnerae T7901]